MMLLGLLLFGFGFMLFYAGKTDQGVWDEARAALGR